MVMYIQQYLKHSALSEIVQAESIDLPWMSNLAGSGLDQ